MKSDYKSTDLPSYNEGIRHGVKIT